MESTTLMSSSRFLIVRTFTLSALLLPLAVPAQTVRTIPSSSPTPSIQQVLTGVRANIATTIATLPDIECQEQAHSVILHNGKVKQDVTLNSTLQARRMNGKTGDFTEERTSVQVKTVDGKPPLVGRDSNLPFFVKNGFGTTYEWIFSPKSEFCWTYKIIPGAATEVNSIGLQATRIGVDPQHCGKSSAGKLATFWLDPVSYQIRRFDFVEPKAMLHRRKFTVFNHLDISSIAPYYVTATTDYSLVSLGQKSYLLPEKVHATAWLKEQNSPDELTYDAQYSDCHRFGSSAHIVDSSVTLVPSP